MANSFIYDELNIIITRVNDEYFSIYGTYGDDVVHPYSGDSMKLIDELFDISFDIFNEGRNILEEIKTLLTKLYHATITFTELEQLDKLTEQAVSTLLLSRILFYNYMAITMG
jgi:hypothetical protein